MFIKKKKDKTHWEQNVVEKVLEKVSVQCLGSFESWDYREDNKIGMNE